MAIFHLNYLNQVQIAANTLSGNRAKSIIQRFPNFPHSGEGTCPPAGNEERVAPATTANPFSFRKENGFDPKESDFEGMAPAPFDRRAV